MQITALEFQKTITQELDITKNKVRYLIADKNWGEEGRSKEAILRRAIRQFLPSNISVGTGFIIKEGQGLYLRPKDAEDVSNQIDIIIYDNTCPPLFSDGDFIITTSSNVKGIIEVKTSITTTKLEESIQKGDSNGDLIDRRRNIFNGIFVFDYKEPIRHETVKEILFRGKGNVNHISLGPDLFIRHWKKKDRYGHRDIKCPKTFYGFYKIEDLSFSYFISNIVECMIKNKCGNRDWFLFPIEGTKEVHRFDALCMTDTL
jgi:hypothetical protein